MSPALKARVIDCMLEALPSLHCEDCDPGGYCRYANTDECRRLVCLNLLDVLEREGAFS